MLSAALTASLALSLEPAAPPLRPHLHRNFIVHSFQTLFTVGKTGLLNTKRGFDVSKFGHIVLLLVFLLLVCLPVLFYLWDCVFLLLFFYLYFFISDYRSAFIHLTCLHDYSPVEVASCN